MEEVKKLINYNIEEVKYLMTNIWMYKLVLPNKLEVNQNFNYF
jgi:hypothetical protein